MVFKLYDRPKPFRTSADVVKAFINVLAIANNFSMMRKANGEECSNIFIAQFIQWH